MSAEPVKSRRERYSEETRRALIESATKLFLEKGFSGTALADVATDSQVTRGAVYHHFQDKQALFQAVMASFESEALEDVRAAAAQADSPWEAGLLALDAFLDRCCDDAYGRIVWQQGPVALGWERWRECAEQYGYGLTRQLLSVLMENGDIDEAPLDVLTRLIFANIAECGLLLSEVGEEEKAEMREVCGEQMHRIFEGLRKVRRTS